MVLRTGGRLVAGVLVGAVVYWGVSFVIGLGPVLVVGWVHQLLWPSVNISPSPTAMALVRWSVGVVTVLVAGFASGAVVALISAASDRRQGATAGALVAVPVALFVLAGLVVQAVRGPSPSAPQVVWYVVALFLIAGGGAVGGSFAIRP
jgi:hypothetical protein